jgi:hypothetical protein
MKMVGASFGDGKRESKHPIGYELRYNFRSAHLPIADEPGKVRDHVRSETWDQRVICGGTSSHTC